jgi:transcriptional regulator with XRE-family HTH domain
MKHAEIKKLNAENEIKDLYYNQGWSYSAIAKKHGLSYQQIYRFLRDDKIRNFDDDKLEAIAMTEDVGPLSVVQNFFQSVHHSSKELAFTAIVNQMLREKLAEVIDKEGVENLTRGDNYELLKQWYNNSDKMNKLVINSQKLLEGYINLFSQVLDVQREVSYVKIVTDLLKREDPELYRKLQKAMDADPEAKRVLEALSREDVVHYWDSETGSVRQQDIEDVINGYD